MTAVTALVLRARAAPASGRFTRARDDAAQALARARVLEAGKPHSTRTGQAALVAAQAAREAGDAAARATRAALAQAQPAGSMAAGHPWAAEASS